MKYRVWLNEWLASCVKPNVKSQTYVRYSTIVRLRIIPKLGEYDMDDLTVPVLQRFTAEMTEQVAPNTVGVIVAVIKSSLVRAKRSGLTEHLHCDDIQRPRMREKKIECFSGLEQRKIENHVFHLEKTKLYGIVLCLYTGLRVGELLALEWKDIDFRRGVLSVTKSCRDSWIDGVYTRITECPKTITSNRVIPLPKQLVPHIKRLRRQSRSNYVISGNDGKIISVRSYQKTFCSVQRRLKLPHRGFHALRHTFATRALECGMDVRTLAELMGHKNPTVTLNRYAHSLMEHKSAMMNKLGKLLM